MKDSSLLWTAMVIGVIGLIGLFFLTSWAELEEVTVDQAKELDDYEEVLLEGTVTGIYSEGNFTVLFLTQLEEIRAVVFDEVNLTEGQLVQVKGEVKEYKGEKEVLVDRIRLVG